MPLRLDLLPTSIRVIEESSADATRRLFGGSLALAFRRGGDGVTVVDKGESLSSSII